MTKQPDNTTDIVESRHHFARYKVDEEVGKISLYIVRTQGTEGKVISRTFKIVLLSFMSHTLNNLTASTNFVQTTSHFLTCFTSQELLQRDVYISASNTCFSLRLLTLPESGIWQLQKSQRNNNKSGDSLFNRKGLRCYFDSICFYR